MKDIHEASDGEAYRALDASLLRDAIETLPPDIRKTLLLHYFMDMPVKEVARVLSSPTSTITWRLHYARKILAAKLGVAAFRPSWAACALRADWTDFSPERPFEVVSGATALFGGRASWTAQPDGTVKGVITLAARAAADMQCVALEAKVENLPVFPLGSGHEADLDLPADGGRTLHLDFGGPVTRFAQDSWQWGGKWNVRFGDALGPRAYNVGDTLLWEVTLSSPDGIALRHVQPFRIAEGFVEAFKSFFGSIPYDLTDRQNEQSWRAIMFVVMRLIGMNVGGEVQTAKGRIDLTIETATDAYVIEVKRDSTPMKAIEQIRDKSYTDKFHLSGKPITLIGIAFSTKKRAVSGAKIVRDEFPSHGAPDITCAPTIAARGAI